MKFDDESNSYKNNEKASINDSEEEIEILLSIRAKKSFTTVDNERDYIKFFFFRNWKKLSKRRMPYDMMNLLRFQNFNCYCEVLKEINAMHWLNISDIYTTSEKC